MPNNASQPYLKISKLNITYKSENHLVRAVKDLSLELKSGEILGLAGESGSGKTSICKSLLGVCPAHLSGKIVYNGKNLLENKKHEWKKIRWNKISYCFPNSREILNPSYSVLEQMIEPMLESGFRRKRAIEHARDLLFKCKLPIEKHDSYPVHLSGGELQRVMIALTLVNDPEMVIFDEPTSGIDIRNRNEIVELLKEILKNKTCIIVTHDLLLLRKLADKIGILYKGVLVELVPAHLFFRNQHHPYSRALYNSFTSLETSREMSRIRDRRNNLSHSTVNGCVFADRCTQAIEKCFKDMPRLLSYYSDRQIACHRKGVVSLIRTTNLSKIYRKSGSLWGPKIQVLKDVNVNVEAGEVVALVGESGAGKTTLGQIICGLIDPEDGEMNIDETVHRNDVQYIFQDPEESLSPRYTVLEAIREPLDIKNKFDLNTKNEMARKMLANVGLYTNAAFCDRFCSQLSSGEAQRLCIGRALITSPRVLVADEPVSRLDPSEQVRVLKLLLELQTDFGIGLFFITHNLYLARKISRRIYVIHQGRIIEEGFTETVLDQPRHPLTRNMVNLAFSKKAEVY